MAAVPGVLRTSVGYCGGSKPEPTYRKVCGDANWEDWAETVRVEYDSSVLSYADVLAAFFIAHDATAGGRSRQYASIIFTHDEQQAATAAEAVANYHRRISTIVEPATDYWAAEAYHQKWLLQRKAPLFKALGPTETDELFGRPATLLNAVAGGRLRPRVARNRLDALLEDGEMDGAAHGRLAALLEEL